MIVFTAAAKLITALALGAGATLGTATVAVTHSSLSPFAQALVLTLVGALVAGFCSIIAALITRQSAQEVKNVLHETRAGIEDVKAKVGADQRESDKGVASEHNDN